MKLLVRLSLLSTALISACPLFAQTAEALPAVNSGDTAWVLISTALVMLMTLPGLALFYGGLVRKKNVLSILMQCAIMLCVISLQWVLFGYSLSFGPEKGFWGGLEWFALKGVGLEPYPAYAATIPHQLFMIFQAMFAVITPALIIGAFAERMKFSAFLLFGVLWSTFVYAPIAHWVWGIDGWLRNLGALDFAGGTVVHINAGIAAIVTAIVIGKRKGLDSPIRPHNLPFTVMGAGLLWFGWFGFNAGSALAANGIAVNAFVVTNTAAAAAGLTWALLEWLRNGKSTTLGVATGAVAGLVAITPAAGFVSIIPAMIIGMGVSILCFVMVDFVKPKLGYDDSLDAFGVHGIGGIWGALATGLFASKAVNSAGADGLFFGNPGLFLIQLKTVLVTIGYSFIMTLIIYKLVDMLIGVRAKDKEEAIGLDLTEHNEGAYTVL
ncbi:MAG: ammonia channel protein [Elusimicrobia bacterium RIFOXYA2_FULL_39_19]|nr:MAG: ammonia channel protein [Elusimicrobia bacterium RIFOXYA2_FULL_39_19]